MKRFTCLLMVALLAAGCGGGESTFLSLRAAGVTAIAAQPDGSLTYADSESNAFRDVSASGEPSIQPRSLITTELIDVLGLMADPQGRTFASLLNGDRTVSVVEVASVPRTVWVGPIATGNPGGALARSPQGRVVIALGDLGDPRRVADSSSLNGKVLTLDPNSGPEQLPNMISTGWTDPEGLTYDQGGSLWIADQDAGGKGRLARVGPRGAIGKPTELATGSEPSGLARYAQQELVLCSAATGKVQRFLLQEGLAIPGRTLGSGCIGPLTATSDRGLAFATAEGIRRTGA